MSLKLLKTAVIPARRLRKPLEILLRNFTRKIEGFSLTLAMAILTAQKALSNILDNTLHVLPLLNTRLLTLLTKNFKMVNCYGFYSRHISDRLKKAIDAFRKKIAVSRYSFYQRQMYKTFGMNPFYCPVCLDILSQTFIYLFDKRRGKEANASFKIINQ